MSGSSDPPPLSAATVAELWAQARALADLAQREISPPHLRRALVVLAVAGSGGDLAGFEAEAQRLQRIAVWLGLDPEPLFAAASAIVAAEDEPARGALVIAGQAALR